ncbi:hypothetical protein L596_025731 [Steinernema carpocapsae]|uniref:Uncharacterized protein n=1 Tax=Steinernema carpocapsae TaxID=34508 RepID=A0A4U5M8V4_STECR|nr:hypothetical protein L596_025731 [Steinernema carpocapsae]
MAAFRELYNGVAFDEIPQRVLTFSTSPCGRGPRDAVRIRRFRARYSIWDEQLVQSGPGGPCKSGNPRLLHAR